MENEFIEVPLSQGKFAIIDYCDEDLVLCYNWHIRFDHGTYYAVRNAYHINGKRTTETMHSMLTGYKITDHINGNGLDNRRINLREATNSQNQWNRLKNRKGSSKYKGVIWDSKARKWRANIQTDGKRQHLGLYYNEVEAAMAYDTAARQHFGKEYGTYNFPEKDERSALG